MSTRVKHKKSRWEKIPKVLQDRIGEILEAGAFLIEDAAKRLCPTDTGALKSSIHTKVIDWHTVIVGTRGEEAPYGAYVEYGTVPHFPPVEDLIPWVRRHQKALGIKKVSKKKGWSVARKLAAEGKFAWELYQKARALAWKIYHYGTKPQPFMRPALAMNRDKIQESVSKALRDIIRKYQI